MNCPYCGTPATWCENKELYGKNMGKSYMCWLCKKCKAYVGCHQNSLIPLGTMANKELRSWRMKAHEVFDPLWKNQGKGARKNAYRKLAERMGVEEIHIAESDIETCKKIIQILTERT